MGGGKVLGLTTHLDAARDLLRTPLAAGLVVHALVGHGGALGEHIAVGDGAEVAEHVLAPVGGLRERPHTGVR